MVHACLEVLLNLVWPSYYFAAFLFIVGLGIAEEWNSNNYSIFARLTSLVV